MRTSFLLLWRGNQRAAYVEWSYSLQHVVIKSTNRGGEIIYALLPRNRSFPLGRILDEIVSAFPFLNSWHALYRQESKNNQSPQQSLHSHPSISLSHQTATISRQRASSSASDTHQTLSNLFDQSLNPVSKTALPSQHAVPYFPVYLARPELCRRAEQHHFQCQLCRFDYQEYASSLRVLLLSTMPNADLEPRSMVSRRDGQLPNIMWWTITDQSQFLHWRKL